MQGENIHTKKRTKFSAGFHPGKQHSEHSIHLCVGVRGEVMPVTASGNQLEAGLNFFLGLGSGPQVAEPLVVEASFEAV